MSKKSDRRDRSSRMITSGGNVPRPGQTAPNVIVLTQPKRFGKDMSDVTVAIRAAENVDFPQRARLYDLYEDILLDTHLTAVVEKRRTAALRSPIEFRRNGKPDDRINEQIKSPWFRRLVSDIVDAQLWGFSLCQFYKKDGWVDYNLVPRKHADPVRRIILRQQTDITGEPWDNYPNLLFIGRPGSLGLLAKAAPWVLYKRNSVGDWSQFSEVFGMPIQEYTYDSDDESSRQRAIADAANTGSLAVFVHGNDTSLNLIESANKSGSADVYERLVDVCNKEISKAILLNTLTTESSSTGTQALGTVHEKSEENVTQSDRQDILDVLNYEMADIFRAMGIDTAGGEFCYPEKKRIDPTAKINIITQLHTGFNLPVGDDYLYEEFGIEKPADYDALKLRQEEERHRQAEREEAAAALVAQDPDGDRPADEGRDARNDGEKGGRANLRNLLGRFFGKAPSQSGGADLEW